MPLDSRPCSYEWPVKLADWAGHECVTPKAGEMDFFKTPAGYDVSRDFLLSNLERADALVVSVEHLCFGSLLASRSDDIRAETALERLRLISRIRALRPELPIYGYGVIMRSSISTLCAGDLNAYREMTRYSYYSGRAQSLGRREIRAERAAMRLPEHLLHKYHFVRSRNHALNMECARLARRGVFTSLMLLQEDAEKYGFHRAEQAELLGVGAENLFLHNGADEGGALAVMRALMPCGMRAQISFTRGGKFRAKYEDRPFAENLDDMLRYAAVARDRRAETLLLIHAPARGSQREATQEGYDGALGAIADRIYALEEGGIRVYLADVAFANGGSAELFYRLKERGALDRLAGYAAWNTASNTLGTSIAQMLSDECAGRANRNFMRERLADDIFYQRLVRPELMRLLTAEGEDVLCLHDAQRAQNLLTEHMRRSLAREGMDAEAFSPRLVWPRLFEIGMTVHKEDRLWKGN